MTVEVTEPRRFDVMDDHKVIDAWLDRTAHCGTISEEAYDELLGDLSAYRVAVERGLKQQIADYLDGYAGGHYMARLCADTIRQSEVFASR